MLYYVKKNHLSPSPMNNLSNQGLPINNLIWLDYYSPCPFIIILCKIQNEDKERKERSKKAKT